MTKDDRELIEATQADRDRASRFFNEGGPAHADLAREFAATRLEALQAQPAIPGDVIENVAREIAIGCNLDPDAISPKTNAAGHEIPEWMFFTVAAQRVIAALTASPPVVEREAIAGIIDPYNANAGDGSHAAYMSWNSALAKADAILALTPVEGVGESFQARVAGWMQQCFGPEIAADKLERNDRFIEESLELVQSLGYSQDRAHALVDYVFGRPIGEPSQEVGGVMVTLAALCEPSSIDMTDAAETELARILQPAIVAKIRAKQAAKPTGSALPISTPVAQGDEVRDALEPFADFLDHMGRGDEHDGLHVFYAPNDPRVVLKVGDFRRAKAALATLTKGARDAR